MIACLIVVVIYAYAFNITMSIQQKNAIFLFLFMSFIGGLIYFLLGYKVKPTEMKDEAFDAETYAKKAWYNRKHETLSDKFGRMTSAVFGTERFYAFLFSRMSDYSPIRMVVGTKPWRIIDWEDNPKSDREKSDWNPWESFGSEYAAKPSETLTDNDRLSRFSSKERHSTQINFGNKEESMDSLKGNLPINKKEKEGN